MSTTTIRLSDQLKHQVADAAQRAGVSTHSFIVSAIEEKTKQDELQHEFFRLAKRREDNIAQTAKTIAWSDMRAYLQARAVGSKAVKPKPKKLRA